MPQTASAPPPRRALLALALSVGIAGCAATTLTSSSPAAPHASESVPPQGSPHYAKLASRGADGHLQAVIEIPAGTNHKIEYAAASNSFACDQQDGRDRVVSFLAYPGNYGFIPSTYMDPARGGDGDALDVLVIGESVPTGTVMGVEIIGVLKLLDGGEADDKLIALPADPAARVLSASDITELSEDVRAILERWFVGYKGPGKMEFGGFGDAAEARQVIERWDGAKPVH